MRNSDYPWWFALACLYYDCKDWCIVHARKVWRWVTMSKPITGLWALIYGRWMDKGDRVIRVISWRGAIIQGRAGRRGVTACFWWFD